MLGVNSSVDPGEFIAGKRTICFKLPAARHLRFEKLRFLILLVG